MGAQKKTKPSIEELQECCDEYLNGWKRAQADLKNFKREETDRITSARKFALQAFMQELLTVIDSFDFALQAVPDEESQKGVLMIKGQLEEVLKREGLEEMELKEGEPFDESMHEAIAEEETTESDRDGTITSILQKGYKLNGQVLRAAKVKVARVKTKD